MSDYKSNASLRAFYLFAASAMWLGIWHTGFTAASWILYVPATTFIFGAITGYCPSWIGFRVLMRE